MNLKFLTIFFIAIFLITGCKQKNDEIDEKVEIKEEATLTQNYNAPFSLNFTDGTTLNMQKISQGFKMELKKPVLFMIFANWCAPCDIQSEILNNIQKNFGDKIEIIGILLDDEANLEEAKKIQDEKKINYKLAFGSSNSFFASTLGGINDIPFIAIYDEEGMFFSQYFGLIPEEILTTELQRIF